MTDFVRLVRLMTLEVERKRGRPLLLAARVPDSLIGAKMDGFDLETWARKHLVDILVPGSRALDNDLENFRRITRGTHIKIYPCHDTHHASDGYQYQPIEVMRGIITNWWSRGADGIQTLNYDNVTVESSGLFRKYGWDTWPNHWPESESRVYAEGGSPEKLKYKDKNFVVERRGGGTWSTDIRPDPHA